MKLLVILESHFYMDGNDVYCDRVVDYNFLKRYLNVFEKVIVCGRCDNINDGKYKLKVSGPNVEFRQLPNFYGIKGLLKNIIRLRKLVNEYINESDAVLYRVPTPISIFTYNQVIKAKKVLAVEFMISADKMIEGNGFLKKIANKIIDNIAKRICLKSNGVSYVTDNVLQKKYPCQALLNQGSNDEFFTENYSTIELDKSNIKKMNWNKDKKPDIIHIIHTGYMDSYRKGQHVLIKAVKPLIDSGYKLEVTFIGDGQKRSEFEQLASDLQIKNNIKFLGTIKDKKIIFDNLKNSHMLVFPTEAEGLPRSVIEAMAAGLPCISSPVDGIPELLSKDMLIPCGDVKGYTDKIKYLIDNWNVMIEIGNQNCENAKRFEKSILDAKREKFYKKIYNLAEQYSDKR